MGSQKFEKVEEYFRGCGENFGVLQKVSEGLMNISEGLKNCERTENLCRGAGGAVREDSSNHAIEAFSIIAAYIFLHFLTTTGRMNGWYKLG